MGGVGSAGVLGGGWPVSAVRVPAGAVLLSGTDLETAFYAVRAAQRYRQWQGLAPSTQLAQLHAVMSGSGQTDVPDEAGAQGEPVLNDLSITEAAGILGCSARHVRRLALGLGGRRVGGRWVLDRLAVAEHAAGTALAVSTITSSSAGLRTGRK